MLRKSSIPNACHSVLFGLLQRDLQSKNSRKLKPRRFPEMNRGSRSCGKSQLFPLYSAVGHMYPSVDGPRCGLWEVMGFEGSIGG